MRDYLKVELLRSSNVLMAMCLISVISSFFLDQKVGNEYYFIVTLKYILFIGALVLRELEDISSNTKK